MEAGTQADHSKSFCLGEALFFSSEIFFTKSQKHFGFIGKHLSEKHFYPWETCKYHVCIEQMEDKLCVLIRGGNYWECDSESRRVTDAKI